MKPLKPGIVLIRFSSEWTYYRAGEIAGFDAARAALLVNQLKVATYFVAEKPVEVVKYDAIVDPILKAVEPIEPIKLVETTEPVVKRSRWNKK